MVAPLTELTKKNTEWEWGEDQKRLYQGLIEALTGNTILAYPRVNDRDWIVDTDASGRALGAVQIQDGEERVIKYASKKSLWNR